MIPLPTVKTLVRQIGEALDDVAERDKAVHIAPANWFTEIASTIAKNVGGPNIECCARGGPPPCLHREWLFDFCVLLYEEQPPTYRFTVQAAVVGEIEWNPRGIDDDFEKLLIVDSLVCFFVFRRWSEVEATKELDRLQSFAERRRQYAQLRGMTQPPVFLLSCHLEPDRRFIHRTVSV